MKYTIEYSKSKSGSITLKFTIDPKEKYVITFDKDNKISRISKSNKIITDNYKPVTIDGGITINDYRYDAIVCIDREGNKSYLIFDENKKLRQYITDKLTTTFNPDIEPFKAATKVASVLNKSLGFYCECYDGSSPGLVCINGKLYNLI